MILSQAIHLWQLLGTAFYTYFILNDVRTVPKTFYATPADLKKCGGQALQAFVGFRVPGPSGFRVYGVYACANVYVCVYIYISR